MVVSGRMHLALAAFRNHVIPICLMGTGKGYSSADKMRGMFDKFIGKTELAPSNTGEFALAVALILNEKKVLKETLEKSLFAIKKESREKKQQFQKRLKLIENPEFIITTHLDTQSDAIEHKKEERLKRAGVLS
jgi:hypothetical protein